MTDLTSLIKAAASRMDLPWELVQAICVTESSMNPWAIRYEPAYRWFYGTADALSPTERAGQQMSWGLMQVMGAVAREHGFTGWFPSLCEPTVGLNYGMRHLAGFYARYKNWPDAIASYNAGSPVKDQEGRYRNQAYVDRVLRHWNEYEIQVQLKETEV